MLTCDSPRFHPLPATCHPLSPLLQRNLFLAGSAAERFARTQGRLLAGQKPGGGERPAKADDVVRLYDALVANVLELNELAAHVGGAAGEALLDACTAKVSGEGGRLGGWLRRAAGGWRRRAEQCIAVQGSFRALWVVVLLLLFAMLRFRPSPDSIQPFAALLTPAPATAAARALPGRSLPLPGALVCGGGAAPRGRGALCPRRAALPAGGGQV